MTEDATGARPARRELAGWQRAAVDFGPLLIFFVVNARAGLMAATAAFMVATAVAIAVSFAIMRHVPAMTWFSALLVGVFGGLTLWLNDETFIKMKPTVVYLIFAAILAFGLVRRRNYLKLVLGPAFHGLSDAGWTILARRWTGFFLLLAIGNELIWRLFSTDLWMHFKLWGDTLLTFLFALAQLPLLRRHGLDSDGGR